MMFLMNGMRAEVEPVPKKKGWYQLTGKHIERWTVAVEDTANDLQSVKLKLNFNARIKGIHDIDPEIAERDPRFNHENTPERASFFVYTEPMDGRTYMLLAVNQAEYALFRFLAPHESGSDEYDPASSYRVEPAAKSAAKKAASKVSPAAKKDTKPAKAPKLAKPEPEKAKAVKAAKVEKALKAVKGAVKPAAKKVAKKVSKRA